MHFRGISCSNCPKLIKIYPFLVIPHACPAFLKYVMTGIGDDELHATIRKVLSEFPNSGIRIMKGHLLSRNIKVSDELVRNALWIVNLKVMLSRSFHCTMIHPCTYSVKSTSALWHIDGNHRLIR